MIVCGLEVELEYNHFEHTMPSCGYNNLAKVSANWLVGTDSSVEPSKWGLDAECDCLSEAENYFISREPVGAYCNCGDYEDDNSIEVCWECARAAVMESYECECGGSVGCLEFKTVPFIYNRTNMRKMIKELKRVFKHMPLKDCINFNESMGHHIHFSRWEDIDSIDTDQCTVNGNRSHLPFTYGNIENIRNKVRGILPEAARDNYFRHYADQTTRSMFMTNGGGRREQEFNFISRNHCEFRSFNVLGVETWAELEQLYVDAMDIIKAELAEPAPDEVTFDVDRYARHSSMGVTGSCEIELENNQLGYYRAYLAQRDLPMTYELPINFTLVCD